MSKSFPTTQSKLDGIFDHLYPKHSENYEEIIQTRESSIYSNKYYRWSGADVLVRPNKGTAASDNFATCSEINPNFSINFNFYSVRLTHYTFQTRTDTNSEYFFPCSWVVEASGDNPKWTEIDRVSDTGFTKYGELKTFKVKRVLNNMRHFRFTLKDRDSQGKGYFVLHRVEFFGTLFSSSSNHCTKALTHNFNKHLFFIFMQLK